MHIHSKIWVWGGVTIRRDKIVIGSNVFIGSNSTILYGVTIGDNVIIGAGSVVTRDIPSGVVAAGVPCKPIGEFEKYREKYIEMTKKYTWKDEWQSSKKRNAQIRFFFRE